MIEPDDVLQLSGFAGLAVGMLIGLYQTMLRDPMLLGGVTHSPEWMIGAHVHFLGLSLVVLFYGYYLDDLFEGYQTLTAVAAIVGQWGLPGSLLLLYGTGLAIFGMIQLPIALVNVAVVLAFLVNFLRRGM